MRRVLIIQARLLSSRLPGKVLMELAGRPMLAQQLRRLRECRCAEEIVIATSELAADDPLEALARAEGVRCCRGSAEDVLSRFVKAARAARADAVVRLTADCPLIDPETVDRVTGELTGHAWECDYASNVLPRSFPRGLDVEAFFMDTLLRMDRMSRDPLSREHVTLAPRSGRPDLFLCRNVRDAADNSDLRWTVDVAPDFELVRRLYEALDLGARVAPYSEVLAYVRARPELARLNAGAETWSPA